MLGGLLGLRVRPLRPLKSVYAHIYIYMYFFVHGDLLGLGIRAVKSCPSLKPLEPTWPSNLGLEIVPPKHM